MRRGLDRATTAACFAAAAFIGLTIGLALAATRNNDTQNALGTFRPDLPSRILDRNGSVITTFFADEERALVPVDEVPRHLIEALLTREDRNFFRHRGWDPVALAKALAGHFLLGRPLRGASTITQQIAGWYYANRRTDDTIFRKIRELWWAFQVERLYTKEEILYQYLNEIPLGHNTSGVEAASQFYFGHSVREITLAESALLVVIYANSSYYSPLKNPERSRERSREILEEMVHLGYTTTGEAEASFREYWDGFDWNRSATSSAFFSREDLAPYFSEYVREELNEVLFGAWDIYRDGLTIHTTLDLGYQAIAEEVMTRHLRLVSDLVESQREGAKTLGRDTYLPVVDLLSLAFGIEEMGAGITRKATEAIREYRVLINPALDAVAALFDLPELKEATFAGYQQRIRDMRSTELQDALISLDSTRGWILAMVGGRKWENTNQWNRATQGRVQPGSAFKPLYYSAAIETRKATMGTMLLDAPTSYQNPDGALYRPLNFLARYEGPVPLWWALADSKNIPSVAVLDLVGIENAIDWSTALLGITDPEEREASFPRPYGYAIALGVSTVSPLSLARAYATFPSGGEAVEPVAILEIVDREGRVILEPERRTQLRRAGATELLSPQTARIMTEILTKTVEVGTLKSARDIARDRGADIAPAWDRPIAGKTGTTQNWAAAWTVGFTPQITTAVWLGFDQGSRSLGRQVTGALAAAPAWAEYMDRVHRDLPVRDFREPGTGLIRQRVCAVTGLLPTEDCPDTAVLTFLAGTQPRTLCDLHPYEALQARAMADRLGSTLDLRSAVPPELFESFLEE